MSPIYAFGKDQPHLASSSWVAPTAQLIGDVTLGEEASVWFGAVLRAEFASIYIGAKSNVQDNTVIHVDFNTPTYVGENVTIGHSCIVHGCHIEGQSLIGMGSIILNRAYIEPFCLIAAGTLIPEGKRIETGHLVMGVPGKIVRPLTAGEKEALEKSAQTYKMNARAYQDNLREVIGP